MTTSKHAVYTSRMRSKKVWIIGDYDVYLFVSATFTPDHCNLPIIFQFKTSSTFRNVAVVEDGKLTRLTADA